MTLFNENHFVAASRCPRAVYLLTHAAPATSFAVMDPDEHRRVLRLAAPLMPGPVVTIQGEPEDRLHQTRQGLKAHQAMLGATLAHEGWMAEVDYLGPHPRGGWQMLAVVPEQSVAKPLLRWLAYQAHIVQAAGVELVEVGVFTLNPGYCRGQRLEPARLFQLQTVTSAVAHASREMAEGLGRFAAAASRLAPDPESAAASSALPLGPHCEDGGDCPFKPRCWREHLPEHNVFHLYQLNRAKAFKLYQEGWAALHLLPRSLRTPRREAQLYAIQTRRPYVDRPALRQFLARLEYPLHCLDFETVSAAVPWMPGLQSFNLIPVQFSLTHVKAPNAAPEHETFLLAGQSDPRLPILDRLKAGLGRRGSILAYNAPFEQMVLGGLVRGQPAEESWYQSLAPRWVDLLEPFKNFYCYYAGQKGSCSLKDVLPAVTGKGYEDLAIQDGQQATRAWLRLIFDRLPDEESARLRLELKAYCRRDTEALVWLVQALQALV
ncbi:MAG: DUF2779 domain-containing protein [Verrucomicrobiae bacterium]|nr:DUF2779 domain-containing protein [Verrucomicrobiae bacterium]